MDIGAALRDAREQRGISLEELSRATKISLPALRAIERNQIDRLPRGIFTRGFLRAYADHVGLDGDDIVKRYLGQFEVPAGTIGATDSNGASESTRPVRSDTGVSESRPHRVSRRLLLAGLAVAIGVAGYLVLRGSRTPAALIQNTAASPKTAERSTDETPGIPVGNAPTSPAEHAIRLDIRTEGPLWISATADGMSVAYQLMQPGERQAIEAQDEVILRVGDAAAFSYTINDRPGRSLGGAGRPVTVRITPQNVGEFVGP